MPEIRRSVCALDCPDCCSLLVTVENERGVKLRGNPEHPVTRGFLCGKVAQYLEREYSPARLLYPQRRIGAKGEGRFERICWEEALDTIAARLRAIAAEFGPEAVLPYSYAGTMGYLNFSGPHRFFHRLGASRLDRTICSTAGMAGATAALGIRYATEPEQFRHAKLILAWGANILGTNVHLWPFVTEARRNGAKLYTIDPRRNRTGAASDKHFFIHPGSDTALALAMMHVIIGENLHDADYVAHYTEGFDALRQRVKPWTPQRAAELTGIEAEGIVSLAREYATTRPAVIRANYGIQRSERGAMAMRAVAYLPVITGSWKEVGGGFQMSTSQAFHVNRNGLERPDLQQIPLGREARIVNMAELGNALTELDRPPVKALMVYNSNPAAIAPDQNRVLRGLRRDDLFTVVMEQFQNDTADYADILLPATTFLEHTDLYYAYGHYHLQLARPALPAPGEAKPNVEVFRLLADRMGFADPCFTDTVDDMVCTLLDSPHPFLKGITIEELDRKGSVRLRLPEPFQPFAAGGYGFEDGRCHFHAETLDYTPPVESRHGDAALKTKYPLELISPKNDDSMNSTFGHRDGVDLQTATLHLNVADAARRGIHTSDQVRVFNDRGDVVLVAVVDDTVQPGVASAPSVRWGKRAPGHRNVNAVTSQRLTDAGGGPTFYSCLVEVERIGD
ncbi:MAG TPA: molybdopterin-dependent oxidoreductase [Bryobacteraceae bacterium]|nr:molybdopterin-dependent oxidoreductase [Bryobacteraceae bacterium]